MRQTAIADTLIAMHSIRFPPEVIFCALFLLAAQLLPSRLRVWLWVAAAAVLCGIGLIQASSPLRGLELNSIPTTGTIFIILIIIVLMRGVSRFEAIVLLALAVVGGPWLMFLLVWPAAWLGIAWFLIRPLIRPQDAPLAADAAGGESRQPLWRRFGVSRLSAQTLPVVPLLVAAFVTRTVMELSQ